MNLIQEFQKRAAAAGLTPDQTQTFINSNGLAEKLAEPSPETIFSQLCDAANVEKSAQAYAYAEGVLTQASQRGLSPEQALQVTKQALASTFPQVQQPEEKQAAAQEEEVAGSEAYFSGMFEKAASFGFSRDQTLAFLQKVANPNALAVISRAAAPAARAVESGAGKILGRSGLGKVLAGLTAVGAGAFGSAALHRHPGVGDQLLSWIKNNPEAAGAIGGAGIGGVAGGLSGLPGDADPNNPEAGRSHVGRNALMGALAGGSVGAGAGHFAPDMFKRLAA